MGAKLTKLGEFIESKKRKTRNPETGHDPAVHGAQLQDRFFNNDAFANVSFEQSSEDKQEAATKIQTQYRQHSATNEVELMREEEAAIKIQAGVRGYIDRQRVLEKKNPEEYARHQHEIENRIAGKEYGINFNDPEVEHAACKIQAGFKGYKARKEIQERQDKLQRVRSLEEKIHVKLDDPEIEAAAVKIQASFKGYKTRKAKQDSDDSQNDVNNYPEVKGEKENKVMADEKETESDKAESENETKTDMQNTDIDLDLNDPELASAASKLQAGFRSRFKNRVKKPTDVTDKKVEGILEVKGQTDIGADANLNNVITDVKNDPKIDQKENTDDIDLNDPELASAASKLQAGFRSRFKNRAKKPVASIDNKVEGISEVKGQTDIGAEANVKNVIEEKVKADIEIDSKVDKNENSEDIDLDLNDPELASAASKLQAGFRSRFKNRAKKPVAIIDKQVEGTSEIVGQNDCSNEKENVVTDVNKNSSVENEVKTDKKENSDDIDLDLNDPELASATSKLQAGFRSRFKNRVKNPTDVTNKKVEGILEVKGQTDIGADTNLNNVITDVKNDPKFFQKENSEDIDLDLNDPELASAASKLQAGFRSRFKNRAKKPVPDKKVEASSEVVGQNDNMKHVVTDVQKDSNVEVKADKKENSDDIDLDLNDPELASAASKLQAGFRSRFKNRVKKPTDVTDKKVEGILEVKDHTDIGADTNLNNVITDVKNDPKIDQKENSEDIDLDLNDPELASAASKLQAGFRSRFKNRAKKSVANIDNEVEGISEVKGQTDIGAEAKVKNVIEEKVKADIEIDCKVDKNENTEEIDLDLNDPDLASAALKLQAGFRGRFKNKAKKAETDNKVEGCVQVIGQTDISSESNLKNVITDPKTDQKETGEEVDLDLNDPELASAALKLQAGFRGRFKNKAKKPVNEDKSKSDTEVKGQTDVEKNSDVQKVKDNVTNIEDVDLDLNDPELASAALMIQAGFRGRLKNKSVKSAKEHEYELAYLVKNDIKLENGAKHTEITDIDLQDPEVEKAATKIQASFKGFKARQEVKHIKEERMHPVERDPMPSHEQTRVNEDNDDKKRDESEEIDIDLDDPATEKAAVKIQSSFRGYKKRKEVTKQKKSDTDLNDPEKSKAAVKIQSSYRGYKTRKDMKKQKKIKTDLNDPEKTKAAVKIQCNYRGYKTRKDMKKQKKDTDGPGESETVAEETVTKEGGSDEAATKETVSEEADTKVTEGKEDETKEEKIDIDLTDPEVEKAAIKIQSGFKGYKVRHEMHKSEAVHEEEKKEGEDEKKDEADEKKDEGGEETKEEVEEKKDGEVKTEEEEKKDEGEVKTEEEGEEKKDEGEVKTEEGGEEKKDEGEVKTEEGGEEKKGETEGAGEKETEEIDIDLNDPEVEKAAVKIQASFKGFKARKDLHAKEDGEHAKDEEHTEETTEEKPADDAPADE